MKSVEFRLDPELCELLPKPLRAPRFIRRFFGPQTAKHLLESLGIPHTEVGTLIVNGRAADLGYVVLDGDTLEACAFQGNQVLATEPRFVLDGHLGRLAAGLRMLGLDSLYGGQSEDQDLARIAQAESRILLTRDRHLLMRKIITQGYLVRHLDPNAQLRELVVRFGLRRWMRPFRRCIHCNHPLEHVEKNQILDRLEPLTQRYYEEFRICPDCGKVYWQGSHVERMERVISALP